MQDLKPRTVKILSVRIDSTSTERVLRFIRVSLENSKKFFIFTPNPEQILRAQTDEVYAKILNSADISLPDGIGLIAAYKFLHLPTTHNLLLKPILYFAQGLGVGFSILFDRKWLTKELKVIRGRDFFIKLVELANKEKWGVFLLGDSLDSAKKAKIALEKNYLNIKLYEARGPDLDDDANLRTIKDESVHIDAMKRINKAAPQLLIIGFRAPVQEKWLYRYLPQLNIGGAMVVGGTFDYISGRKPLPPAWIADTGLEWLWRLLKGDQKAKRIINAFPKFALKIYLTKLLQK
ncbi:MAG: Glycosyl transferase, WecB/TagA/CpsF family [Candidatus Woesebacteria bacterium GW2011_GWB1_38_8]|uniref:Glycosyl transferase, WecB/TagA/CpsF family n=1 Tax=Candidatus Woesebacteria bacterium GW2011_GWB1_38_8 TaxID=1618570 RepID=A0A0G0L099_9BACT|nr:MAG: Glycosyl transferase, WecB/TagA/CpsF family [Candidatus Woesebacteria bacterium GW2011_GWB1_38_8]